MHRQKNPIVNTYISYETYIAKQNYFFVGGGGRGGGAGGKCCFIPVGAHFYHAEVVVLPC